MTQAGNLRPEQLALLFSHMPVGFSVADEDGADRGVVETVLPVERADRPGAV